MIRNPDQKPTITALSKDRPGHLDVLISDISSVKSEPDAQSIIDRVAPTYIVFSAGAGGKGGAERTFAIDRDACIAFARAAAATKTVTKFLVVSYIGSRKAPAPWWSKEDTKAMEETNNGALKNYHVAKLAADQAITALGKKRGEGFAAISLRPGTLTDEEGEGKVVVGKTGSRGPVRRGDVARVAAEVLERVDKSIWLDFYQGGETITDAVGKAVSEGVDCVEGEDVAAMVKEWAT